MISIKFGIHDALFGYKVLRKTVLTNKKLSYAIHVLFI